MILLSKLIHVSYAWLRHIEIECFLPTVKHRGMKTMLVTQI